MEFSFQYISLSTIHIIRCGCCGLDNYALHPGQQQIDISSLIQGHKRPHVEDDDVVPAEDADKDVVAALLAAINADEDDSPSPDTQTTAATIVRNVCHMTQ